jgi:S1-C subfamily serine protease
VIRETLKATQAATFAISLPAKALQGMPRPTGTGFFVSEDGWFVTAGHVITVDGEVRDDLDQSHLEKEPRDGWPQHFTGMALEFIDEAADVALLKVEVDPEKGGVRPLRISRRALEEGEPVYAFGYPLSTGGMQDAGEGITVGISVICPRTTSAIVASTLEQAGLVTAVGGPPSEYVLDKALNYGNSGGPIVSTQTGRVHAVCTRFQPVGVPQPHIQLDEGKPFVVQIPSLYGVVSNLSGDRLVDAFVERKIPLDET